MQKKHPHIGYCVQASLAVSSYWTPPAWKDSHVDQQVVHSAAADGGADAVSGVRVGAASGRRSVDRRRGRLRSRRRPSYHTVPPTPVPAATVKSRAILRDLRPTQPTMPSLNKSSDAYQTWQFNRLTEPALVSTYIVVLVIAMMFHIYSG